MKNDVCSELYTDSDIDRFTIHNLSFCFSGMKLEMMPHASFILAWLLLSVIGVCHCATISGKTTFYILV